MPTFDPAACARRLADDPGHARVVHVRRVAARPGDEVEMPGWVHPHLRRALAAEGIERLWSHQVACAEAVRAGRHTVLATGTASGKSLGYLLPVLGAVADGALAPSGRGATALYVAPTKALAGDQAARVDRLGVPGVRAATYDGDTPAEERRWIRRHAGLVLSNPDMLHHALLPGHASWSAFWRALSYVVVDECHTYRGVFGSHVAAVLRRLRRVAALYGAEPTFVLASATSADPAAHAATLLGLDVGAVTDDGSARAATTFVLIDPESGPGEDDTGPADGAGDAGRAAPGTTGAPAEPVRSDPAGAGDAHASGAATPGSSGPSDRRAEEGRPSTLTRSAVLLADLVASEVQAVAFARSRAGVEVLAATARRRLETTRPDLAGTVTAYRGGYLPEDRRALEDALRDGRLRGLATTSALELGVDISGLDAVVLAGWPGSRASLWQRAGRAGRRGRDSLAVLVAGDDPLDAYLVHHPEAVFDEPVEACVLDPENPHVLAGHLAAAAAESPLVPADTAAFGPGTPDLLAHLERRGLLRRRPTGWFWTREDRPSDHVALRGSGETVRVVERDTGRVLGTVDAPRADAAVHTGAVHLHRQRTFVVTGLDLEDGSAHVVEGDPGWTTQARSVSAFDVLDEESRAEFGDVTLSFGPVAVRSRVTSFVRRTPAGRVLGEHPLDLPERTLRTRAVWWTVTEEALAAAGLDRARIPGSAHAAEHAAIGLLPLLATADRWDIGGVSTRRHPDTDLPTIMVYDGHPGGAGFARRGHDVAADWLRRTRETVAGCPCARGCPACVQSPKCGNGNEPLDKAGAVTLLDVVLAAMGAGPPR